MHHYTIRFRSAMHTAVLLLSFSGAWAQQDIARQLVNPFIGTGGHGHTFPGACVPFGLVQLSPDTRTDGYHDWDGAAGYHYSDSIIFGFSHTHLSGTGVSDLCDVLLMPYALDAGTRAEPASWSSHFDHDKEEAHAGYYQVYLPDARVNAELTATQRTGLHRYHFQRGTSAALRLDLSHRDFVEQGSIVRVNDREVVGERRSSSWARDQRLFYCIRFSHPMLPRAAENALAEQIAASVREVDVFHFGDLAGEPLVVKVGISAVSVEGARRNLEAEVPHWDFTRVRNDATDTWNKALGRIRVKGGTLTEQRIFYTALYHTMIAPCIFNDVDGQYRGMDGQVHHADHDVYTIFSLWDTFRALHPLMTILEPERTKDWVRTMLLHYRHGGRLPVWELWGNETDCMIGYHSVSVIADAHMKGLVDFDQRALLDAMVASAEQDHFGLEAYKRRGFISSEDEAESVSKTLEYAYNDACISAMAIRLLDKPTATRFHERSTYWRNLFCTDTRFFRPRRNGGFLQPFDPREVNFHFTEANAWQYSLFVPHDIETLNTYHVRFGTGNLEMHLDEMFSTSSEVTGRHQSDITGLIGQYAHGNEPSHHMAYLYNRVERPEKTRAMVKRIMAEQYSDAPDGLSGNEDCGQMSAWYVLSALGIYPIAPGVEAYYELGYPLFDEATVQLADGRQWTMQVDAGGAPLPKRGETTPTRLPHSVLVNGGAMRFGVDRVPFPVPVHIPTVLDGAYIPEHPRPGAPVIQAPGAAFREPMEVRVLGRGACRVADDAGVRPCPVGDPFLLDASATVTVDWHERLAPVEARFHKTDGSRTATLHSTYAQQYAAGGEQALVDGLRGGKDFRTGEWQGFQGQDLVASIDLGKPMRVKRAGVGVLQDQKSWIWYPSEVEFAFSMNGRQWTTMLVTNEVPRTEEGALTQELWTPVLDSRVRYVKITARNAGPCPDWHPGAGNPTWIFADEFLLETAP